MTAVDTLLDTPQAKPEPKRDRWGRPLIIFPGETKPRPLTRVTTLAGTLSDRWALEQWSNRMVVLGVAQRRDLYAAAAACGPDDKQRLNEIAEQAKEAAGATAGATTGTALHQLTERLDAGEQVDAPEPWDADLAAYQAALQAHQIEIIPEWVEQFMVCQRLEVAGTADRIVRHQNHLRISDLKTGSYLNWGEIAIQLACYANAETHYDPATNTHVPAPDIDQTTGLVIHLPAGTGTCTVYQIDLTAGWDWAHTAYRVREWRKAKPAWALPSPTFATAPVGADPARVEWVKSRLLDLKQNHPAALEYLAGNWPLGVPTFTTNHAHTPDELTLIERVVADVEATFKIPFPETNRPLSATGLVDRIKALPADLIATIEADAKAEGIPSLGSPSITPEQLTRVDELLEPLEETHRERCDHAKASLHDAVGDDDSMATALLHAVTVRRETGPTDDYTQLTGPETDALQAVCAAVTTGLVVMVAATDADAPAEWVLEIKDPGATLDLLLTGRTKGEIRDTGRTIAEQLSLTKPRSAADVASDPILAATTHATPTNS